ncbi:MAG: OmpP1/FadL family transporter [Coraliomargarita sp.]
MYKQSRLLLALGSSLLITSSVSNAAATRVAYIDPFATARGNAFTATADNPSAVFYNAAGLTQLEGTQVQANVFAISLAYEYDGALGSDDMDDDFQAIPSFFVSHKFEDSDFAFGFGAYAPFALGSDWGSDASFALDPRVPYEAELEYVKYHLVAAWQITDTLSIAFGPSFDKTDLDVKANALEFDADGDDIGYSASILWQPNQHHSFGLNYQAKTDIEYSGTADLFIPNTGFVPFDADADLVFPESIVFGYSYRPNEQWNIEFNIDWTNWDRVDDLTLEGVPGGLAYELNWDSAFIWELGATRYFDNGWNVSAGYTYVENAVPQGDLLPIVPDNDRHFFAVGIGQAIGQFYWQATYQYAYSDERKIKGNTFGTVNGDYDLDSQAFALSLGYRW